MISRLAITYASLYQVLFIFNILLYPSFRHVFPQFTNILILLSSISLIVLFFVWKDKVTTQDVIFKKKFFISYLFFVAYNLGCILFLFGKYIKSSNEQIISLLLNNIRFLVEFPCWLLISVFLYKEVNSGKQVFPYWLHIISIISVFINLHGNMIIDLAFFEGYQISYQTWGDLFAIVGLISISQSKSINKFLLIILYSYLLMAIPSRSSLVGFLVAIILLVFFGSNRYKGLKIMYILMFLISLIAISYYKNVIVLILEKILTGTRHETLFSVESSNSNIERLHTFDAGLHAFLNNPIFGEFAFQINALGSAGLYVHNWLDIFVQFGLFGGGLFILTLYYFKKTYKFRKLLNIQLKLVVFSLLVFSLVSFILARNYQVGYLYIGIGMALIYSNRTL